MTTQSEKKYTLKLTELQAKILLSMLGAVKPSYAAKDSVAGIFYQDGHENRPYNQLYTQIRSPLGTYPFDRVCTTAGECEWGIMWREVLNKKHGQKPFAPPKPQYVCVDLSGSSSNHIAWVFKDLINVTAGGGTYSPSIIEKLKQAHKEVSNG